MVFFGASAACNKVDQKPSNPPPGKDSLSAPIAEQPLSTTDSSFVAVWKKVSGASSYNLYVASDSNFSGLLTGFDPKSVTDTFYKLDHLNPNSSYYYKVTATDGKNHFSTASNIIKASTTNIGADKYVLIGSHDDSLHCFDATNGNEIWAGFLGDWATSNPTVNGNMVYIGSRDTKLHAFDLNTGAEKWTINANGWIISTPLVSNGILYFGSQHGRVYACDALTGTLNWKSAIIDSGLPASFYASPTIDDATLFIGSTGAVLKDSLYAFNISDGSLKWERYVGGPCYTGPTVYQGLVYQAAYRPTDVPGDLYALDKTTGAVVWTFHSAHRFQGSITIDKGVLYIGCEDNYLYALDPLTGSVIWKNLLNSSPNWSSAAFEDGNIYIGISTSLYALDESTGTPKWHVTTNNNFDFDPVVSNGTVYLANYDDRLYAYDAGSGNLKWSAKTGGLVATAPCVVRTNGKVLESAGSGNTQ